jgi:transcriptional regulator with XRE-family HTH domain
LSCRNFGQGLAKNILAGRHVDLARAVKTTANTVSRWETAACKPSIADLEMLARFFGVPIAVFFPEAHRRPERTRLSAQLPTLMIGIPKCPIQKGTATKAESLKLCDLCRQCLGALMSLMSLIPKSYRRKWRRALLKGRRPSVPVSRYHYRRCPPPPLDWPPEDPEFPPECPPE